MDIQQKAEQFRYALQLFAKTLDESTALQIATLYDEWNPNTYQYKSGDYCTYGLHGNGDPRLYVCLQNHVSQPNYSPDVSHSLFKLIGVDENGYTEWSQPVGTSDAYMKDDIVSYNGTLYISNVDFNVWAPNIHGWSIYNH